MAKIRGFLQRLLLIATTLCIFREAAPAEVMSRIYNPITRTMADKIVTLSGHDLTIDQVIQIARYGARVTISEGAKERSADNYGLLLEAQAEGVPVYIMNRGPGIGRETVILEGDPLSPENKKKLELRELTAFQLGPSRGDGPEIADEDLVRALMAIRANVMISEAPSPQLLQMLVDLLNKGVTPVVESRGTVSEADISVLGNIGGTMVGRGEAYYHGRRMSAAEALQQAGLTPLKPFALDNSTLNNSNAYATALAAMLLVEGRQALDWADMTYAMDLNGMNSSITPLSEPVQLKRPEKWLNWHAKRILGILKGSYLFDGDPKRILSDPDSLRASSIRQGAGWQAWATLRDSVVFQMNSSDHNPVVSADLSPSASWELSTPQMMKYYVKGGSYSKGKHGFVVSSANWDPFPMANDVEAFTIALANVGVVVVQRIYRFNNAFFTGVTPSDVMPLDQMGRLAPEGGGSLAMNLWQEMQVLANPIPPEGASTDAEANGDIESQAAVKASRGRLAVDILMHILGQDLLTGTYWMNLRLTQDPNRNFGSGPEAAMAAFRRIIPWQTNTQAASRAPAATLAYDFVRTTPLSSLAPLASPPPEGELLGTPSVH